MRKCVRGWRCRSELARELFNPPTAREASSLLQVFWRPEGVLYGAGYIVRQLSQMYAGAGAVGASLPRELFNPPTAREQARSYRFFGVRRGGCMAPGTSFANSPACNHCRAIGHRLSWNRLWKYAKWPISVTPISSGLMRKCMRGWRCRSELARELFSPPTAREASSFLQVFWRPEGVLYGAGYIVRQLFRL